VELGGIEPPSISRWAPVIRLFPLQRCAALPAGRLLMHQVRKSRNDFPFGHRSFSTSAFFLAVIPRFCCRAAVNWPRATLRLTVALCHLIRRRERTACWQLFFCPVLRVWATRVARSNIESDVETCQPLWTYVTP